MKVQELSEERKKQYIKATLDRGSFLRKVNVWTASDIYYEDWLSNFCDLNDRYIASKILNNFLFYSKPIVARLLYDSVGNAISLISRKLRSSALDFYKREIYYSYVPGEQPNPTDSGYLFMRKLREELHIPQSRAYGFADLCALLQAQGETRSFQIVLCDDFVGSGNQCYQALMESSLGRFGSIYEFAKRFGHTIAYAPLIANHTGAMRIRRLLPELLFTPAHILGNEYNLFSETCLCWEGDRDLFNSGVELIRRTSADLGIPDNDSTVSVKGFGGQGLFIGFEHGIPDSDPAFFFCNANGWKPLMRKCYERD